MPAVIITFFIRETIQFLILKKNKNHSFFFLKKYNSCITKQSQETPSTRAISVTGLEHENFPELFLQGLHEVEHSLLQVSSL
jgi:hypothetical protein